jgi:hypothetical protein
MSALPHQQKTDCDLKLCDHLQKRLMCYKFTGANRRHTSLQDMLEHQPIQPARTIHYLWNTYKAPSLV